MTIFESGVRDFLGPKSRTECDFVYLNRSARPGAEQVRAFVDEWVARYPAEHRQDLVSRLRDPDGPNFNSAGFELILFAWATSMGYEVRVHPELPSACKKRPDFLLTKGAQESFYMEATLASEFDLAHAAAEKRKNVVLESIEGLYSPNFFVGINAEGNPTTPPSTKALRRDLSAWLASLDPDRVMQEFDASGGDALPQWEWAHEGWKIVFEAIPKSPHARGKKQRVIGVEFGGAHWVDSWTPIRDAVRAKGTHYGKLDKPIIIAVSADCMSMDRIDEAQALFGAEELVFDRGNPGAPPRFRRQPNGAWRGPKGPVFTRVSGALIVQSTNLWNIASRSPTLYFNPWASCSLPPSLRALKHARVEDGRLGWIEGRVFRDVLGLPVGWPAEC